MTDPVRRAFAWYSQQPFLLALTTMLCWAGNFIAARGVRADVPPITLAMLRWIGALMILLPIAWPHLKRDLPTILAHWRIMVLLSLFGVAGFNTLGYIGMQYTVAINGGLLQSSQPVLIALIVLAIYREMPTVAQVIGVAISLIGVVYVVTRGDPTLLMTLEFNRGDIWVMAAFTSWAVYTALLRDQPPVHWQSFLAATFLLGALMLMPFWGLELAAGRSVNLTWAAVAAILYVTLFPALVAITCYNRAVQLAGANRVAPFFHLLPVLTSVLAILILGEHLQLFHVLGLVVIMTGIAIASRHGTSGALP